MPQSSPLHFQGITSKMIFNIYKTPDINHTVGDTMRNESHLDGSMRTISNIYQCYTNGRILLLLEEIGDENYSK